MLGHLLTATLAALGALGTALGAGLSMIGLCCTGPALATAAAGGAATGAAASVTPVTWPFWTAGAVLLTAAALWHRRHRTSTCRSRRMPPGSPEQPRPSGPTGPHG
ncbi:hypothetical protein SGM_5195 [Streptomyces griseoaurantiacus M045]|uniref:Uncharacterized protein n=2 Tax=Streptomyces TaxID=1883 RepID=F3NQC0_9ACTN|nr:MULTISPECIES: hypothetical protein [Streptomyces]EGG44380.1 hypothetical protein SGM_5195 [Streptomyces griseoaurantiacus M045]